MPPKKRTQKQKQSQKQSVVVNVKLERPARRRRTKKAPASASASAPEMRQLPPVSYIMQGGTNLPYWSQSMPFVTAPSKPISIATTAGTMPVISETPVTEVAVKTPVSRPKSIIGRDEMITPVSKSQGLSLEIPTTPMSFTEQIETPAKSITEMIVPEPVSTERMVSSPKQSKVTSNSSRNVIEKELVNKYGEDIGFLKTFRNKRELYQYYKQRISVSAEEENVLDVAELYGKPKPQSMVSELTFPSMPSAPKVSSMVSSIATTKEMSSPSIMYENPAKKPFWSRAIGEESDPELRI